MRGTSAVQLPLAGIATTAHLAEAEAQGGRASPIDTSTATLGGAIWFRQKESSADWMYTCHSELMAFVGLGSPPNYTTRILVRPNLSSVSRVARSDRADGC